MTAADAERSVEGARHPRKCMRRRLMRMVTHYDVDRPQCRDAVAALREIAAKRLAVT